jgi:hypothetical protein
MRECRTSGSVRGVPSNGHPYRNPKNASTVEQSDIKDVFVTLAGSRDWHHLVKIHAS